MTSLWNLYNRLDQLQRKLGYRLAASVVAQACGAGEQRLVSVRVEIAERGDKRHDGPQGIVVMRSAPGRHAGHLETVLGDPE